MCIKYEYFPSQLKLWYIIPIYKKGNKFDISNYRSLCSLYQFSKIKNIYIDQWPPLGFFKGGPMPPLEFAKGGPMPPLGFSKGGPMPPLEFFKGGQNFLKGGQCPPLGGAVYHPGHHHGSHKDFTCCVGCSKDGLSIYMNSYLTLMEFMSSSRRIKRDMMKEDEEE